MSMKLLRRSGTFLELSTTEDRSGLVTRTEKVETQAMSEVTSVDRRRSSLVSMRDVAFHSTPCGPPGQAVQRVKLLI